MVYELDLPRQKTASQMHATKKRLLIGVINGTFDFSSFSSLKVYNIFTGEAWSE